MKRSVKATGVKNIHVLPFVSNFAVLVHKIELLLTEVEEDLPVDRTVSLPEKRPSGDLFEIEQEVRSILAERCDRRCH